VSSGRVLVVNVGSSSVKVRLLAADDAVLFEEDLTVDGQGFDPAALRSALAAIADQVDVVGHRVVHGGTTFTSAVLIDGAVRRRLGELADLAPLHQSQSLAAIDLSCEVLPGVPSVACFDTAFHSAMPEAAATYAVPEPWREQLGVRRYGFHGLSHAAVCQRAADILDRPLGALRIVSCHLGAGASLAAVLHGVSVDTTMGFTPLEGLVMATRSGTVDPGVVTWLVGHKGLGIEQVEEALEHSSGLLGLSGSSDMATIEAAAARGDRRSALAVAVYVHRLRAGIASMASAMNGLDVLTFTGGVGERAARIRAAAVDGLGFLGARLDPTLNTSAVPDAEITGPGSVVRTLVVASREDLRIAAEVRSLLR